MPSDALLLVEETETRTTSLLSVNGEVLTSKDFNRLPVIPLGPDVEVVGRALDEPTLQVWVLCLFDGRLKRAVYDRADDALLGSLPVFTIRDT